MFKLFVFLSFIHFTALGATTTPITEIKTNTRNLTIDPRSNAIGTPCSNETTQAWLDIVFIVDTSNSMTKHALRALSAEVATIMQSFNFGQLGNHTTRGAIISYATTVTTIYNLIDTINFDYFEDALFKLSNYANSDDSGGNLQGALQQSYNLLQAQKSFRKPVIILIAAAYNNVGFQDADQTAKFIKNNGISIIVINFALSDGVLTNALQNISSDGYYYISDQHGLYLSVSYALTQINCFCPPNSMQLRIFNPIGQNYTDYADCYYGFDGDTSPIIAEKACDPGILVASTTQETLDFISDNIIPHDLKGAKKFTIGLHKNANSEWKWSDYNQTEYNLGNFPEFENIPNANDNYGYMWNYKGFEWKLQTGNNVPLPYICQLRACDASYICDQTPLFKSSRGT